MQQKKCVKKTMTDYETHTLGNDNPNNHTWTSGHTVEKYVNRQLNKVKNINAEKYITRSHRRFKNIMSETMSIRPDGIVTTSTPELVFKSLLYHKEIVVPSSEEGLIVETKVRFVSGTLDDKITHVCNEKYGDVYRLTGFMVIIVVGGLSERTMHLRGYFGKCFDRKCKCQTYGRNDWNSREKTILRMKGDHIYMIPMSALVRGYVSE